MSQILCIRKVRYQCHRNRRTRIISVGVGEGVFGVCQSDLRVGSVVDRVESLKEALTEDEVQARSTLAAEISNDQINAIGSTTN